MVVSFHHILPVGIYSHLAHEPQIQDIATSTGTLAGLSNALDLQKVEPVDPALQKSVGMLRLTSSSQRKVIFVLPS